MATCESCGEEADEKEMKEVKFYGSRSLLCKKCAAYMTKGQG